MVAALGLSACGRTGPLEPPPGPAGIAPVAAAPASPSSFLAPSSAPPAAPGAAGSQEDYPVISKNGFDAAGNPVAGPGQKRSFILDPLLR
jgi:hypothetical protein